MITNTASICRLYKEIAHKSMHYIYKYMQEQYIVWQWADYYSFICFNIKCLFFLLSVVHFFCFYVIMWCQIYIPFIDRGFGIFELDLQDVFKNFSRGFICFSFFLCCISVNFFVFFFFLITRCFVNLIETQANTLYIFSYHLLKSIVKFYYLPLITFTHSFIYKNAFYICLSLAFF